MLSKIQIWMLILYILSIPFQNILNITLVGGTLTKYLGLLLMLITIFEILLRGSIILPKFIIYFFLFIVHTLLISLTSTLTSVSIGWIIQLAQLVGLYILVSMKSYSKVDYDKIIYAVILAGVFASSLIISNLFAGNVTEEARIVVGTADKISDPNHVAAALILPIILLFDININFILKIALISLLFFSIILTGSRGGLIGLSFAFIYMFLVGKMSLKFKVINVFIILITGIIVYSYLLPLLPPVIANRFSLDLLIQTGGTGRADLWKDALNMFLSNPIFGHGYNLYEKISLYENAAHNIYIQLLVETGLIGFIIFAAFIISIIRSSKNISKLPAAFGVLVSSAFLGTIGYPYFWLAIFIPVLHQIDTKEGALIEHGK